MKKIIKYNTKYIITLVIVFLILVIHFPYYIDAPGGITDISNKIEIEAYKSSGSFNLTYVKEYKATIPILLVSLINKDWKILKKEEILLDNETDSSYLLRDKIFLNESISNAIYVAYKKANKDIKITSNFLYITYVLSEANTNLKTGDQILEINNTKIKNKEDITSIIQNLDIGDKLDIKVESNGKQIDKYAYIIEDNSTKIIGILLSNVNQYETYPKVSVKVDSNESGSSGGLITALSIYNSLIEHDITHNLTIVGTGTIDINGNIGSIGGVEYKLKSAVKNKADLFIVPNDENYEEALELKEKNNYNIDIVGVSTFDEILDYLDSL